MKSKVMTEKIISVILVTMLLLTTKIFAANDKFSTTLNVNSIQAKREDNITITIGLENIAIESGEKGIGGYTAGIKFDSSVLEYVSSKGTDKWEAPFYQDGLITGNTSDGEVVKTTQSIGTITFKVKKDAKLGETEIQLTNFSGSTIANDIYTADKSIKVTIVDNNNNSGNNNGGNNNSGNNNGGNNNNGINNNGGNNNNGNNNGNNNNTNKVTNNITEIKEATNGKIPQTGEKSIFIIAGIGLVTVCLIISYIKMKK